MVNIPDDFINYIKDSLFWIVSSWNGKTLKSGLPYYGEALISDEELVKFKTILEKWRGLFSLGTEEINLTGDFLIDEMKYEKVIYKKCELLNILDGLLQLCDKAECLLEFTKEYQFFRAIFMMNERGSNVTMYLLYYYV